MTDKTNLMFIKLTLLFLLPAVVPEVRNIVFFYISLNILKVIPRKFLIETISHVERHLQV